MGVFSDLVASISTYANEKRKTGVVLVFIFFKKKPKLTEQSSPFGHYLFTLRIVYTFKTC
jgi:hypothetical protein